MSLFPLVASKKVLSWPLSKGGSCFPLVFSVGEVDIHSASGSEAMAAFTSQPAATTPAAYARRDQAGQWTRTENVEEQMPISTQRRRFKTPPGGVEGTRQCHGAEPGLRYAEVRSLAG